METDFRKQRSETFLAEHELTQDELKQLIEDKINRARAFSETLQLREKHTAMFD